ncbi:MAG: FAD-dependent catabolic D-arginine dehydrogenase DauA [Rhodoferax sp.]
MQDFDVIIIGAGMAGASAAFFLAPRCRVLMLEAETQPGYHATGRSAAMYSQTYGNATVRALTTASRAFFEQPPEGFCDHAVLSPRGSLIVGGPGDEAVLDQTLHTLHASLPSVTRWSAQAVLSAVPVLRPERVVGGVFEPDAMDMDVHAIHHGFLRGARHAGAQLVCDARVTRLEHRAGVWQVHTPAGDWQAPVVVNAAGAWGDALAQTAGVRPLGLVPKRRTALLLDAPADGAFARWPLVIDAHEQIYFKPDAGALLVSPANEDPVAPQDVQPEELDVALAVARLQELTHLSVRRVRRQWAGLRSFVADKTPVLGYDAQVPGFFWLVGQGGYGIQTAPAMGELAAALVLRQSLPQGLTRLGVCAQDLSPQRLM